MADAARTMRRQAPMVAGAPPAVGAVHHVGHHDMGVQMRVEIAVDPVGERRRDQARGRHDLALLTRAPSAPRRVRLDVAQRALHALAVRAPRHWRATSSPPKREDHAHRLRRAEGQVEPAHGGTIRSQPMPRCGVATVEDRPQVARIDGPAQAQALRRPGPTSPPARPPRAGARAAPGPGRTR